MGIIIKLYNFFLGVKNKFVGKINVWLTVFILVKGMELHRSTQNKATRFFRKPLYQSSPYAVPVIPFVNGKFSPDDNYFLEL